MQSGDVMLCNGCDCIQGECNCHNCPDANPFRVGDLAKSKYRTGKILETDRNYVRIGSEWHNCKDVVLINSDGREYTVETLVKLLSLNFTCLSTTLPTMRAVTAFGRYMVNNQGYWTPGSGEQPCDGIHDGMRLCNEHYRKVMREEIGNGLKCATARVPF